MFKSLLRTQLLELNSIVWRLSAVYFLPVRGINSLSGLSVAANAAHDAWEGFYNRHNSNPSFLLLPLSACLVVCDTFRYIFLEVVVVERIIVFMASVGTKKLSSDLCNSLRHRFWAGFPDFFANHFDPDIEQMKAYSERTSGFDNLDQNQFFHPGLYVI